MAGYIAHVIVRGTYFSAEMVAGNYMFIADEACDDWSAGKGLYDYGAEAVVVMHELGPL